MSIIAELATKVLPLYGLVVVGFFLNRRFKVPEQYFSAALLYVLLPILVVDNVMQASSTQLAVIPPLTFLLATLMNIPARLAARTIAPDYDKNLLASTFSFFNVAFFGIPTVTALFGQEQLTTVICAYIGTALYGDTIGYYLVARTKLPVGQAVSKVFKIPLLYAFLIGLVLNLNGVKSPQAWSPVLDGLGWIVSAVGMLMIGFNLSGVTLKTVNYVSLVKITAARTVGAALLMGGLLWAEYTWIGELERKSQQVLMLIPFFPVAVTVTVFASFLETEEESAASLVAFTAFVSLLLVPLVSLFF